LAGWDRRWLFEQAERCELAIPEDQQLKEQFFTQLLTKVDVIPPSLALSQAALESGWGTSRFARVGNNLFGTWCFEPGCGIVPKRRSARATHEVKVYDSPKKSFLDYIWNLNSKSAYREMRRIRRAARLDGRPVLGVELALGLVRYSQEGHAYIGKVAQVIRSNDLGEYDT
jgi:Bax protein